MWLIFILPLLVNSELESIKYSPGFCSLVSLSLPNTSSPASFFLFISELLEKLLKTKTFVEKKNRRREVSLGHCSPHVSKAEGVGGNLWQRLWLKWHAPYSQCPVVWEKGTTQILSRSSQNKASGTFGILPNFFYFFFPFLFFYLC